MGWNLDDRTVLDNHLKRYCIEFLIFSKKKTVLPNSKTFGTILKTQSRGWSSLKYGSSHLYWLNSPALVTPRWLALDQSAFWQSISGCKTKISVVKMQKKMKTHQGIFSLEFDVSPLRLVWKIKIQIKVPQRAKFNEKWLVLEFDF